MTKAKIFSALFLIIFLRTHRKVRIIRTELIKKVEPARLDVGFSKLCLGTDKEVVFIFFGTDIIFFEHIDHFISQLIIQFIPLGK